MAMDRSIDDNLPGFVSYVAVSTLFNEECTPRPVTHSVKMFNQLYVSLLLTCSETIIPVILLQRVLQLLEAAQLRGGALASLESLIEGG